MRHTMNNKELSVPGTSSFMNRGNTCWLNSALYCVTHLPLLCYWFLTHEVDKGLTESTVTKLLAEIFKDVWTINKTISPEKLQHLISRIDTNFTLFRQHDSHEAIVLLLDRIHEETKRDVKEIQVQISKEAMDIKKELQMESDNKQEFEKIQELMREKIVIKDETTRVTLLNEAFNYLELLFEDFFISSIKEHSVITRLFNGVNLTFRICLDCKFASCTFSNYTCLNLSIPKQGKTLIDSLGEYFDVSSLSGDNSVFCERCKEKKPFNMFTTAYRLPPILFICIKRYDNSLEKTKTEVKAPLELDMSDHTNGLLKDTDCMYKLFTTIQHSGSLNWGHYTAYCLNEGDRKWYSCNDTLIKPVASPDFDHSYVLMYVNQNYVRDTMK